MGIRAGSERQQAAAGGRRLRGPWCRPEAAASMGRRSAPADGGGAVSHGPFSGHGPSSGQGPSSAGGEAACAGRVRLASAVNVRLASAVNVRLASAVNVRTQEAIDVLAVCLQLSYESLGRGPSRLVFWSRPCSAVARVSPAAVARVSPGRRRSSIAWPPSLEYHRPPSLEYRRAPSLEYRRASVARVSPGRRRSSIAGPPSLEYRRAGPCSARSVVAERPRAWGVGSRGGSAPVGAEPT